MKAKNMKKNSRKNAEKAVDLLKSFCEDAHISHKDRYLEGYIHINYNKDDELKVKRTLDNLAKVFDCKYSSRMAFSETPGSEDRALGIEGCTICEYEFLPKRITDYKIYIKVKQDHRII